MSQLSLSFGRKLKTSGGYFLFCLVKTELMFHENLPVARTLESYDSNRGFKKKKKKMLKWE